VEDLYELLKEIKEKHPEIEGVSSGAIASTY
jgi:diphthamide synthase (EF-2-diphthine--ammonia ligase)